MDTVVCPYACNTATYQKHNELRMANASSLDSIEVNFIQEDAITQKTEEELFGLAKLFSEVGGLSSFFFGFSCLVIFQLLESCYRFWNRWIRSRSTLRRKEQNFCRISKSIALCRGISYAPHCLPMSENSPIVPCKNIQHMRPAHDLLPSADSDLSVWMDIDGTLASVSIQWWMAIKSSLVNVHPFIDEMTLSFSTSLSPNFSFLSHLNPILGENRFSMARTDLHCRFARFCTAFMVSLPMTSELPNWMTNRKTGEMYANFHECSVIIFEHK